MHLERSQKKFQQIFPKNGRVITVQHDLVNEKNTIFLLQGCRTEKLYQKYLENRHIKKKMHGESITGGLGALQGGPWKHTPKKS